MKQMDAVGEKVRARRQALVDLLNASDKPISGTELSKRFSVSRQIIVQDISMIKEQGCEVLSTRLGYVMQKTPLAERVFKVWHTREQTEDELSLIVDLGGVVSDVFVWHRVYGRVEAKLNIRSRLDVSNFLEGVRSGKSTELMSITGGYHYHTVSAESEALLDRIEQALSDHRYIVPEI